MQYSSTSICTVMNNEGVYGGIPPSCPLDLSLTRRPQRRIRGMVPIYLYLLSTVYTNASYVCTYVLYLRHK